MKSKIWKIQRPIVTRENPEMCFAYTKQGLTVRTPMTDALYALFGDEYKIYVRASIKNGNLIIGKRVEEQPW